MLMLFYICAGLAVLAAISVVAHRTPIYSALSLIVVLCSLAVVYLLLGAEFIAVVQVIVYAGAIMVLFVFVIMILNAGREAQTERSRMARWIGAPVVAAFLAGVLLAIWRQFPAGATHPASALNAGPTAIGRLLFANYTLPFEVTSVLILVAILGAVVLAKKDF